MSDLNLVQRRRSDGSLCLVGSTHSPDDEDKVFPPEFDFSFKALGAGRFPAKVEGDKITLEYANARAVYKIVGGLRSYTARSDEYAEFPDSGHHAVLEGYEFFDTPPLDTAKRDELLAAKEA